MTSRQRILLVDDDPIMRELASEKLRAADYDVALAEDGAAALEILRRDGADLVISDLEMPIMDGFKLTETIRAEESLAQTPVIVVTASDHADAVDRAFAAGATSFLAKPINWTLFSQAVMFVLRASNDQHALIAARDLAEAGAKFKDGLMSVMSHELRTPLNAIIGFGQLLTDQFEKQSDPVHKEYAEYIVDGGRRLLRNISDMLLASEARSGPIKIDETEACLEDVLEEARALASNAVKTARAEIRLNIQNRNLEFRCDVSLMARAIANLIENAATFSPRGSEITLGAALTKKGDLAVMVKDQGPGVPEDKLAELAAPFTKSDMSLRRSKGGLGLGLPLTHAIAAAHGGKLHLQSRENEGVKALVVLPASRLIGVAASGNASNAA